MTDIRDLRRWMVGVAVAGVLAILLVTIAAAR